MKLYLLSMLFIVTSILYAQPAYNEQFLGSSGGDAVAMNKEWAFVGDADTDTMNAYKLDYSTFQWVAQSFPAAPKAGRFGASVSIDGEKMVVGAPDVETWRMEANTITIQDTYQNPNFTTITLQRTYEQPPLIFALASKDGGNPSAVKIRNRTNNSFEIVHAEPMNEDGPHIAMTISYFAIERGDHVLSDGTRIYAGEITTRKVRRSNASGDDKGWNTITYPVAFSAQPMVLAEIQTMNNEINNVPTDPSEPWLTAAIQNVGVSSLELTMDRSEVLTNTQVAQDESVAFLVMDVKTGAFRDINNNLIGFESIYSDVIIRGWDNGCFNTTFTQVFLNAPLVVATKDTLNGGDGGWLRSCNLTSNEIGLTVDEDRYQDSERGHVAEQAGILAFDTAFVATFKQGEAYLYEYNTLLGVWELKEAIEPTIYSDDMKFGSSVAVHSSASTTQVSIGAPAAINANSDTGKVFTYRYDGTQVIPESVLTGTVDEALRFGEHIDMKGDYLMVGAPDEQSAVGAADLVGAAYTYQYNTATSSYDPYPAGGTNHHIKLANSNERVGNTVAINQEGNVSMVSSAPLSNPSEAYLFTDSGGVWTQSYQISYKNSVDTDDDVYMISRRDASTFNYFRFYDTPFGGEVMKTDISGTKGSDFYSSTELYKEQMIANQPSQNRAVTLSVPCGIKPTHLVANEWAMVSVPCGDGTATIADLFGDDIDAINGSNASYGDSGNWVMYKQDGSDYSGTSASMQMMVTTDAMELGISYWIISDKDVALKADGDASAGTGITSYSPIDFSDPSSNRPVDVAGYYLVTLPAISGTKPKVMVANPYPRVIQWNKVMVQDDALSERAPIDQQNQLSGGEIVNPIGYIYDTTQTAGTGQPYRAITANGTPGFNAEVNPYQGIWIKKEIGVANARLCMPFEK